MKTNTETENKIEIKNGVNVTQLLETIEQVKQKPELGNFRFRASNEWQNGTLNVAKIEGLFGAGQEFSRENSFLLNIDEPHVLCGEDSAPNPVEYILAAVSGCITTSLVAHASARGFQIDSVQSEYEGDIDLKPFLGVEKGDYGYKEININFRVLGDAPLEALKEFADMSPVLDTLRRPIVVNVSISRE